MVCMKAMPLLPPNFLSGFFGLRGLTCCRLEGLTIAAIMLAVQGVAGVVGTAMGFATLAKLLTATLLRGSTSRAPGHLARWITLGLGPGCTRLPFCLELLVMLLNHDKLKSL